MVQFYKIAGLTVKMDSFGKTVERAKKYLCEPTENVDIEISSKVLAEEGFDINAHWPQFDDDEREHGATGGLFYRALLKFNGMKLHSSAVVVDGKAYLFTANHGTGKSTHTGLWLKMFGDRAYILNDDKPAIRLEDGVWYAYGTPWSGKNDISVNAKVPLAGIAVVNRNETNEIERFTGIEAIHNIISQVNRPIKAEYRIKLMELLDNLVQTVPIWKLKCNMDPEAAVVSYEAMSGEKVYER